MQQLTVQSKDVYAPYYKSLSKKAKNTKSTGMLHHYEITITKRWMNKGGEETVSFRFKLEFNPRFVDWLNISIYLCNLSKLFDPV